MNFTVKENGKRVANPSCRGTRMQGKEFVVFYDKLLGELGFKLEDGGRVKKYVHSSTDYDHSVSPLCVFWREHPYILSIERGDFYATHNIGGEYDLYDFVSRIIEDVRSVWDNHELLGGKQK